MSNYCFQQTEFLSCWMSKEVISDTVSTTQQYFVSDPLQTEEMMIEVLMCRQQNSREKFCELRDELLFPPAGEVDRLLAASDVAADTRSLLLTAAARLKHSKQKRSRKIYTHNLVPAVCFLLDFWVFHSLFFCFDDENTFFSPVEPSGGSPVWCRPPGNQRRPRPLFLAGKRHRTSAEAQTHRHRNTCEELRCWSFKVLTCQVCEKASPNTSSERRICALWAWLSLQTWPDHHHWACRGRSLEGRTQYHYYIYVIIIQLFTIWDILIWMTWSVSLIIISVRLYFIENKPSQCTNSHLQSSATLLLFFITFGHKYWKCDSVSVSINTDKLYNINSSLSMLPLHHTLLDN